MKNITNILLNTDNNNLRLADIFFDNKIRSIKYLSEKIDWSEINTKQKLSIWLSALNIKNNEDPNTINGNFCLLMPGAIDPHVHFDTPGFEFREDFEHASIAAAYGGVTTIIDMPCTSIPPVTNLKNLKTKLDAVKYRSLIDFAFWGGINGNDITDMSKIKKQIDELSKAGVAGFKVYVISGMSEFADLTYEQIMEAAKIVKKTRKPLAVHAEDKFLINGKMNSFLSQNKNTWKEYCQSRDVEAEVKAVNELISVADKTNCRIHIVHLSSAEGLESIREAKGKNINISAETCPHYLHFTQNDFENEDIKNYLKTAPPVKFEIDNKALWNGIACSDITFVTTDHAGCNPKEEKVSTNFWNVYGGIPGVEHRVPFLFSEGFLKGNLSLENTIKHLSTNSANFFQMATKGEIKKGKDADFALIDLWDNQVVTANDMHSKGKYTPFEGVNFKASVQKTILRGNIIMDKLNNSIGNIGFGEFIKL